MVILPKAIYQFKEIPHNSNDTHQKYKYSNPEIYMEIQKTPNSQAILSRMANTKITTSSVPDFELH
jgi:hypothetical protein